MGEFSYLYSQLRYWEGEARRLRSEIKKWKRRKKDVEGVQNSLRSVAQNSAGDVNSKISKTSDKLERAIDCPEKESALDAIFSGKMERNVDGDPDLSNAKGAISQEIRICEGKIIELENRLQAAEREISRILDMIARLAVD